MVSRFGTKQRLLATIGIYLCFFITELAVALRTGSLALTADAFHYLNDLIGFTVALIALIVKRRSVRSGDIRSFGWQRAPIVGAFFNGSFLLALGVSIFFQSVERFIDVHEIDDAIPILAMGCVGLTLNILSVAILRGHHCHGHNHSHSPDHSHSSERQDVESPFSAKDNTGVATEEGQPSSVFRHLHEDHHHSKLSTSASSRRDLGMVGVLMHVLSDAINNIGVIVAAAIIAFTTWDARHLADPAASVLISIVIFCSSLPLLKSSAVILLQSAPSTMKIQEIQEDLETIPGVESVHELHIWQLDEQKTVATAHLVFADNDPSEFSMRASIARECFHAYGIHSVTLQTESTLGDLSQGYPKTKVRAPCQATCSRECEDLRCCTHDANRENCSPVSTPEASIGRSTSTLDALSISNSINKGPRVSINDIKIVKTDCTNDQEGTCK